jgi:formate hydrogenlyase transcriptional activator
MDMGKPVSQPMGLAMPPPDRPEQDVTGLAKLPSVGFADLNMESLFALSPDAILATNIHGIVQGSNPQATELFGYAQAELIGMTIEALLPERFRGRHLGYRENLNADPRVRPTANQKAAAINLSCLRKDGTECPVDILLKPAKTIAGPIVLTFVRDTSQQRSAQGAAQQAAEAVMLQMSSAFLANLDARKLFGVIAESVRDLIPHDAATLALLDISTGMLRVHFLEPEGLNVHPDEVRLPVAGSPASEVFRTREPLLLDRIEGSPFARETTLHLTRLGMRSGCWIPLIWAGRPIGTLAVASRVEVAFAWRDAEILSQLANHVAIMVNNPVFFGQAEDLSQRTKFERQVLEDETNTDHRFEDIVGESLGLRNVLNDVATVAPTDATVLIQGETGTGKELLARAIHRLSLRKERPFIKLNCAAIPPGLLESELFGHEKGAFTGAIARKLGRLELAQEGTLFLDEIGELPLDLQPKVLRALQEREIERLGGTRPIKVNVRLIAATNRDLARMVAEKQFRADLFYRLKVFPIFAPSLRDRVGDIPALVRHFVSIHSRHMRKAITTIPEATMAALMRWTWPGNIRELENFLERAVILTRGSVLYVPLGELEAVELEMAQPDMDDKVRDARTTGTTHAAAERQHIVNAMRDAKGHISGENGAAARLGLRRTTLNSKLKKLAIAKIDYM